MTTNGRLLSWSGGKDATLALYECQQEGKPVSRLFTTVSEHTRRSSMHGVRPVLHRAQANALGIPISFVDVPDGSNEAYEDAMQDALSHAETVVFADLFLEDVREYRESLVEEVHIEPEFPLWQRDTRTLFEAFVDAGFRAKIVVVDGAALSPAWLGEELTAGLLDSLPDTVDPCGENGEFHTFVWDGPSFEWPVRVRPGRRVTRTLGEADYHYLDLLPRG